MRLRRRAKVPFTVDEEARVKASAKGAGMTQAKFMRQAVLAATGDAEKPKLRKGIHSQELLHALNVIALQIKKHGTNINQLAHQANAGMVPITRKEVEYVLNFNQVLMSKAIAAVERLLP